MREYRKDNSSFIVNPKDYTPDKEMMEPTKDESNCEDDGELIVWAIS